MKIENFLDKYESKTYYGLWPFSIGDYRVASNSVSGVF